MKRSAFICGGAFLYFFLYIFPIQLLPMKAFNQTGIHVLKGRVIRADSREPILSAVVHLVELRIRAITDAEGWFVFENLDAGRTTLVISHSQYFEHSVVLQIPVASELEIEVRPLPRYHETVTVTAAPWTVDRLDVAQSANLMDTQEVRARSGLSVGEAVANMPGVRNISAGEAGGTPMIRGQTNERIRVLNNGFPHDYYQFSRRHMPNIETYDSNSIEVIRGPASVLYGTQAMGGLANLVSAPPPTAPQNDHIFHGEGLLGYGSNNEAKVGHVQIEGAAGGLGGRIAWTRRAAEHTSTPDGDLPNTDYGQQAGLLGIGYRSLGGFSLRGQYRYWENELGFYIPSQPEFRLKLRNDSGEIEAVMPSEHGDWRIATNVSRNARRVFPAGRTHGAKVDLRLLTQIFRISFQHKPAGRFRGWLQMEYSRQKNESFGPTTLLPFYKNRTWAAAIFEEVRLVRSGKLDRLVLNLGLRYDNRRLEVPANLQRGIPDDFDKNYAPVTGSVGIVYRFRPSFSVGFSFSRGWRNPSEYELFADGPHDGALLYERGSSSLKEETNLNAEFTLRLEKKRMRAFVALFRDSQGNYIYQKLTGQVQDGFPVSVFSQSNAVVRGFEGQLAVDTAEWLTLSIAGDALRSKNRATGTRLPFSPPDRAILSAHFHGLSSVDWIHPFVEIRGILTGEGKISGLDEPFPLDTESYALLDLGAGVQRRFDAGILSLNLWISNLTNRSYRDFLDTYKLYALSPGRGIRATLGFLF